MRNMVFFWVALYGAVNLIPEWIIGLDSDSVCLRVGLLAGYVLAFLIWIGKNGRQQEAGLKHPQGLAEAPVFLLPLAAFPVCNLLTSGAPALNAALVLQMLCVAIVEELFFRGFLLDALRKYGTVAAVLLTSGAFGLAHGLNFGGDPKMGYVWLQICCSFCASLYYCCFVVRFGSVLPCAAAHFLTNISASGTIDSSWSHICLTGGMIISVYFSWILIMDKKRRQ